MEERLDEERLDELEEVLDYLEYAIRSNKSEDLVDDIQDIIDKVKDEFDYWCDLAAKEAQEEYDRQMASWNADRM